MNLMPIVYFFAFIIYLWLVIFVFTRNPKAKLNSICALLISSFGIWAFTYILKSNTSLHTEAMFWDNISSFGWCSFPGFALWFTLILAKKEKIQKKWFFYPLLFLIPSVLIYQQWNGNLISRYQKITCGWADVWAPGFWPYLFYMYYISFIILSLYFVLDFWKKVKKPHEKKQARIIFITSLISFISGSVTDVLLPQLGYSIPSLASITTLVWAIGIVYVITKYRLMTITVAFASAKIISTMPDTLFLILPDTSIVDINDAGCKLTGYTREELIGKPVEILFTRESSLFMGAEFGKFLNEGMVKDYSMSYRTKNNENIPISFSGSVVRDRKGEVIGIVGIGRDIREILRLQQRERELYIAAEKARRKTLEDARAGLERMVAKRTSALERMHLASLNIMEDLDMRKKELEKAYDELDIARMNLENSNSFIESVIGSMTDCFAVVDTGGEIIKVNQAFINLFANKNVKDSAKQILGTGIADLLPVESIFGKRFKKGFITDTPISNVEINYQLNEKKNVPLSLSSAPVFDAKSGISGTVIILRDISLQKETEESLRYLASHDILTSLPNRTLLNDRVSQAISRANRYNYFIAILLLDLDRFKEINDTLGHQAGDCLLQEIASRLKNCLRKYDTVARMGGDEFVLVIAEMKDDNDIVVIANRILKVFERPIQINDEKIHITTSIGVSCYPNDGNNIEILLKNADIAMYSAKKLGGNVFCFFKSDMKKMSEETLIIKNNLINAIEKNEFILFYQPLVEIDSGKIISAEALIRWEHPKLGLVEPLHFITIAEATGLIIPIGEWVLRTACTQCKAWQEKGGPGIPVSVNISTRQLYDTHLVNKIIEIIQVSGLSPEDLILEITESSAMQSVENSIQIIKRLHKYGIQIFLDDFGSGYSSLNWLKLLPVQALKIDRFFIQHIVNDPFDAAIVKAIISMAHSLNIKVIAEGVENVEQLNFLRSIRYLTNNNMVKCDEVQGYFFSKPIPAFEFTKLLKAQQGFSEQTI